MLAGTQIVLGSSLLQFRQDALAKDDPKAWEQIDTPVDKEIVFLDIGFFPGNKQRGFLLGTRQTLLETNNGGVTWEKKDIPDIQDDDINYRFTSISLSDDGKEGWIIGKPAVLLHTEDGGNTWTKKKLSQKLPGAPYQIFALGPGQVELVTDQGAIYKSTDDATTWRSQVMETVDATLNRTSSSGISGASYYEGYFSIISRNDRGEYVAVSSRGNFYMSWKPGQFAWEPHNRPGGRRVQSMGWTPQEGIWLTTKGGDLFYSEGASKDKFDQASINSRGFGILGIGFKNDKEGFACGGSGSLYYSNDSGKSWKRNKDTDNIPGNLYSVKFFGPQNGYVLGNAGILLKYVG